MLIIFDKDNTLVARVDDKRPANTIEEQILLDGVAEKCATLLQQGHTLAVISNQGGVAFGILTENQAECLVQHAAQLIKAAAWRVCPYHPNGTVQRFAKQSLFRKPKPGMIFQIMNELGFSANDVIYVGDMESDRLTATAAGVRFIWANQFFSQQSRKEKE